MFGLILWNSYTVTSVKLRKKGSIVFFDTKYLLYILIWLHDFPGVLDGDAFVTTEADWSTLQMELCEVVKCSNVVC